MGWGQKNNAKQETSKKKKHSSSNSKIKSKSKCKCKSKVNGKDRYVRKASW